LTSASLQQRAQMTRLAAVIVTPLALALVALFASAGLAEPFLIGASRPLGAVAAKMPRTW